MSNGLLVMNSVVTSPSSVAPCSMSMPSRKPDEAAWAERPRVRLPGALEHIDPVGAVVAVPGVGEPCRVPDHLDRHAGVGVGDERLQRHAELELIDVQLTPGAWRWSRPLELVGVVGVGRAQDHGKRYPVSVAGQVQLGPGLAPVDRVGAGQVPP